MGHDLRPGEWFHVFFLAQLGKYVPGTAWAYVSQMELSRSKGIRRANSVFVMLLGAGMTVLASFALGWVSLGDSTVSWLPTWLRGVAGGCGAVGTLIIAVRPQWIGRVITRLPDRLQIHGANLASLSSLWVPTAWTWLASVLYGLHILALSLPTSGLSWELVTQSIGGFPTAWVVGFLAFVVPAGVGVREVVLAAFLTPSLGSGGALAVVVVSRFVIIIAEALLMASAPLLGSRTNTQ